MSVKQTIKSCPNCYSNIILFSNLPQSFTYKKVYLDTISTISPVKVLQCQKCNYYFFQDTSFNPNKGYINSQKYKNLIASKQDELQILYEIYKKSFVSFSTMEELLYEMYLKTRSLKNLKKLIKHTNKFLKYKPSIESDLTFKRYYTLGEYYRRSKQFKKAKKIFSFIISEGFFIDKDAIKACSKQLQLINKKDANYEILNNKVTCNQHLKESEEKCKKDEALPLIKDELCLVDLQWETRSYQTPFSFVKKNNLYDIYIFDYKNTQIYLSMQFITIDNFSSIEIFNCFIDFSKNTYISPEEKKKILNNKKVKSILVKFISKYIMRYLREIKIKIIYCDKTLVDYDKEIDATFCRYYEHKQTFQGGYVYGIYPNPFKKFQKQIQKKSLLDI